MTAERTTHPTDPVLPDVRMHVVTPAAPVDAVCVETRRCTARDKAAGVVRHVAFDVSGTPLAGSWRSGQSFGVIPPGLDASGKPHKLRLYSIASPTRGEDGQGTVLATTVKRTIDEHWDTHKLFLGVCSNYLCDLSPGDRVKLTGPNGKRFVLPADPAAHDYLFFATGTGIAPFRGMIADILSQPGASRVVLIMGSPYSTDLLYHDDFQRLDAEQPRFNYLTAISRERQADGGPPLYVQDRLATHRAMLEPMLASTRTLIYICGLAGMELGILQQLAPLPPTAREGFIHCDSATLADVKNWKRSMLHKEIKTTRRVFLEVY